MEGEDLHVLVRTPPGEAPPAAVTLVAKQGGKEVTQELRAAAPAPAARLAERWAARRIAALEQAGASTKDEVVKLSLDHGVMSRHTAFLVLESEEAYAEHAIERRQAKRAADGDPKVSGADLESVAGEQARLGMDRIQPGDPEISIPAPPDARSVVVVFPFGETKVATYEPELRRWSVRFLIDAATPDGTYEVKVRIAHADGRVEMTRLSYVVDTRRPAVRVALRPAPGRPGSYEVRASQVLDRDDVRVALPPPLRVGSIEQLRRRHGARVADLARVEVRFPDGAIVSLDMTKPGELAGLWTPARSPEEPVALSVVAVDRALNQGVSRVVAPLDGTSVLAGVAPRPAPRVSPGAAARPAQVHAALSDVRACLPLAGGRFLAASAGGLWLVDGEGAIERRWTALDGLPETRVHALLDEGERLWIGTEAGLAEARLDGGALSIARAYPSKPVRAIARHEGALYAATWGGGVARLDGERGRLDEVPVRRPQAGDRGRVGALGVFSGKLVAGTEDGAVYRLDGDVLAPLPPPEAGEPLGAVWALAEHDGRLWIGALSGLASFDGRRVRRESGADVRALRVVDGALWAGSYGQGLLRRDGRRFAEAGTAEPFVQAIGARGGARCLGGRDGLLVARREGAAFQAARVPALPSNDIAALATSGERVWAGTFDQGLAVLEAGRWRRVEGARLDARINAIAVARGGEGAPVWVATARGLVRIDGARIDRLTDEDGLPSADVHALAALRDGRVLVGTARGAAIVEGGAVSPLGKTGGLPPGAVWSVAEGPGGLLLLGTSRGLLYGATGGEWRRLSMASGHLRDDWITALHVRGETVWAGTYNAGVEELTWDGSAFSTRHLGGGYVNLAGLLRDGETLYAATMGGLLSRPVGAGPGVAWSVIEGAAPGRDVTAVAKRGGELWVASRRGITKLVPQDGGPP